MKRTESSDFYDNHREGSLRRDYSLTVLEFLQNNKTCIILIVTAAVSVMAAVILMYAERQREYIPALEPVKIKSQSFAEWDRYCTEEVTDGKINIAVADAQTLDELYGIGEVLSQRIITQREKEPFRTIEDIMKVSGIGWDKFEKIKHKITLGKE